jgi:hypothetical protein
MTTPDLTLQSQGMKNYSSSDGLWFHIHRILQTWLPLTTICSVLLPIICAKKKFDDEYDLKMDLGNFFSQKSQDFYERGIFSLPECWQQVIDINGAYIIET